MVSVVCIIGTGPELIKMAPVIKNRQKYYAIELVFKHSGQHYNDNKSNIFKREIILPEPDDDLNLGSGTPGAQLAKIIGECEKLFHKCQPDLVLLEGNTNTANASSVALIKAGIPYSCIEAGLRYYGHKMLEEINRVITYT